MRIVLIRHGESEANLAHVINDDPAKPVNLTARGRAQAVAAAERLCGMGFVHAYASQFPRARQTAEILLRQQACPLDIDARLNERISGMDGQHVDAFNDLVRPDPLHIKPVHGESFLEQMVRVRGFLDEIAARHTDGVVLAVSHENPILAALALSAAEPARLLHSGIANCGWNELEWPPVRT